MQPAARGDPLVAVTVVVVKRRRARIGIDLCGDAHTPPTVTASANARFLAEDIVYVINGRPARGARATARRIWRKAHLSITVLRACARARGGDGFVDAAALPR